MLHEIVHWQYIGYRGLKSTWIKDWGNDPVTGQEIYPPLDPQKGYGPYSSMQINKRYGRGSENADNYAWYALEAYVLQEKHGQCGGQLQPPLRQLNDPLPYGG